MRKENKAQIIESIAAQLKETPNFYVTDVEGLNAEATSKLRRACYEKEIKLVVVKNTLFYKALEMNEVAGFEQFESVLKGSTAVMFCNTANAPAKLIKEFSKDGGKPALKVQWFRSALTLALRTLRHLLTSSLVRSLSVISSDCFSHLLKMLSQLLLHRAVVKSQVS